jgi:hypothetical protein
MPTRRFILSTTAFSYVRSNSRFIHYGSILWNEDIHYNWGVDESAAIGHSDLSILPKQSDGTFGLVCLGIAVIGAAITFVPVIEFVAAAGDAAAYSALACAIDQ